MSDPLKIFANNLKTLRTERGWTQEDVAWRAEMKPAAYGRIERAEVNPTVRTVAKLAAGFNVADAGVLMRDVRDPPLW